MRDSDGDRFVVTGESKMTLDGKSSLHPIHGSAQGLSGYVEASFSDGTVSREPPPKMRVVIPIANVTSGNALQDREMRKLIGNRANPDIVAELKDLRPLGSANRYAATGSITVNGVTRQADGEVTVQLSGERLNVTGTQVFDMRQFGIEPPRLFIFKVSPEMTIALDIVAKREG